MKLIRVFTGVILLVFSGQALALFMPAGFQVGTDNTVVTSDGDC